MFIGQQKGRTTQEKIKHNFGMPKPEGYRKALRLMKMAEKFSMPIVTCVRSIQNRLRWESAKPEKQTSE
jgi:acetyl-CoA carboxylase carboxyl transferase subunit alpha